MENKELNKLIIIGNGFDLAHGLETGYENFMLWVINKDYDNYIDRKSSIGIFEKSKTAMTTWTRPKDHKFKSIKEFHEAFNNLKDISFENTFFRHLLDRHNIQNWVNVENEYFNNLRAHFSSDNLPNELHKEFEQIKNLLIEYIATIDTNKKIASIENLLQSMFQMPQFQINSEISHKIHVLNFNYTDTFEKYIMPYRPHNNVEVNYIHGDVSRKDQNPIIFGYGDDTDAKYIEIEQKGQNEYLKYIKDFDYLKTQNYENLESFVEGVEQFEVYILGHSCGKSDRTLLKYIFQHKNCQKIFIKYKVEEDYFDKTKEIARAFDKKTEFRNKVASIKNPKVGSLVG